MMSRYYCNIHGRGQGATLIGFATAAERDSVRDVDTIIRRVEIDVPDDRAMLSAAPTPPVQSRDDVLEEAAKTRSDWDKDCLRWRGRILTGAKKHWCYDWDGLPVDETTPEIESCHCFDGDALHRGEHIKEGGEA